MAVYELKNELLCVTIDSHGAELKSLKRIHDNQEYMWTQLQTEMQFCKSRCNFVN